MEARTQLAAWQPGQRLQVEAMDCVKKHHSQGTGVLIGHVGDAPDAQRPASSKSPWDGQARRSHGIINEQLPQALRALARRVVLHLAEQINDSDIHALTRRSG